MVLPILFGIGHDVMNVRRWVRRRRRRGGRQHPAVVAVGRQTGACGSVELPFIPRGGDDGSDDVSFSLDFKMSALCTHGGVCK